MISCRSDLYKRIAVAHIDIYEEKQTKLSFSVRVFCDTSIWREMRELVMGSTGKTWSSAGGWSMDPKNGAPEYTKYDLGLWYYEFTNGGHDNSNFLARKVIGTLVRLGMTNTMSSPIEMTGYNGDEKILHVAHFDVSRDQESKLKESLNGNT